MNSRLTLLLIAFLFLTATPAFSQTETDTTETEEILPAPEEPAATSGRRWYLGTAFDLGIFSSAAFERPGFNRELSYLRFTLGTNWGIHFHYDFDEHFGLYTGLGIKNIGFTEKHGDSTIKRRVYTIGVPLGFKIGNLGGRKFAILGGGLDFPFNYREKGWVSRKDKTKFSEWFGDRTPSVMPYLFAGMSFKPAIILKVQFYPSNFFNTSFEEDADASGYKAKPYKGYDARLLLLTLGVDIHYRKAARAEDSGSE